MSERMGATASPAPDGSPVAAAGGRLGLSARVVPAGRPSPVAEVLAPGRCPGPRPRDRPAGSAGVTPPATPASRHRTRGTPPARRGREPGAGPVAAPGSTRVGGSEPEGRTPPDVVGDASP